MNIPRCSSFSLNTKKLRCTMLLPIDFRGNGGPILRAREQTGAAIGLRGRRPFLRISITEELNTCTAFFSHCHRSPSFPSISMEASCSTISSGRHRLSSLPGASLPRKAQELPVWLRCSVSTFGYRRSSLALTGQISLYVPRKSLQVLCSRGREFSVLEASSIDEIYDALAECLFPEEAPRSDPNLKQIVALAGPPGAGKSTLASQVAQRVNKKWAQRVSSFDSPDRQQDVATVLPMDGFHLYRHQLDKMENPEEAHARRGAPWTFDPVRLLSLLQTLRNEGSVYAPSFDHGVGDPIEDDIFVSFQHKVVIIEGNYLLLNEGVWKDVGCMFDEKWFIEVDIDTAMQRVLNRHISTGKSPDMAKWRIEYNDRPNAELINKSKQSADLIIRSVSF